MPHAQQYKQSKNNNKTIIIGNFCDNFDNFKKLNLTNEMLACSLVFTMCRGTMYTYKYILMEAAKFKD